MSTLEQIGNFIIEHWEKLSPVLYEIIVRIIPTRTNISIIDNMWKILNLIITNRRKPKGNEMIANTSNGKIKNLIDVRIDKHVLFALLIFVSSVTCVAQSPVTTQSRGLFLYNGSDTTSLKNIRQNLQNITGNTGGLIFDKINNKWRVWDPADTAWVDWNFFNGGSASGSFWPLGGVGTITNDIVMNGNVWNFSHNANAYTVNLQNLFDLQIGTDGTITTINNFTINGGNQLVFEAVNQINLGGVSDTYLGSNAATDVGNITSLTKHFFTATAVRAGINIGSFATNPTTLVNGDMWYNSTSGRLYERVGGSNMVSANILDADITTLRLPFFSGVTGRMITDGDLTFTGGNTLNATNITTNNISPPGVFTFNAGNAATFITADDFIFNPVSDFRITPGGFFQLPALINDDTETRLLTVSTTNGNVEYRNASSLIPSLTATQIGFGDGSNLLSGETGLTWESTSNVMTMGLSSGVHALISDEFIAFNGGPGVNYGGIDYVAGTSITFGSPSRVILQSNNNGISLRYDGAGTNADLIIEDITGSMRSSCAGAPAGAVYNNGDGILRICP